jgi:hypothetical protein
LPRSSSFTSCMIENNITVMGVELPFAPPNLF